MYIAYFFFSSRRRHTRWPRDWSSDVCSSDLRFHEHRERQVLDHLHRRRRGGPALPRLPDRAARGEVQLPRGQLPADPWGAAHQGAAGELRGAGRAAHPARRALQADVRQLPARRPSDDGAAGRRLGTVDLLPGLAGPLRRGAEPAVDRAAAGQGAHHGRLRPPDRPGPCPAVPGQPAFPDRELPPPDLGFPVEEYIADPSIVRAMEQLLILHADHEQNCSTSAVRLVGSSQANLFTSISAGIGALSGPAHGGANAAVMEMLDEIQERDIDPRDFMEKVKRKEDGIRLMGFGHRVYKNYDPRARIVKAIADDVLESLGVHDSRLELAMKLEEIALKDDYFVERKLYPNVDFYTGLIYKAIGFPTEMFTVLFAIGRLPGWIAQWQEMVHDPETKIGRPRQIYTGHAEREYKEMAERTGTSELRLAELQADIEKRG